MIGTLPAIYPLIHSTLLNVGKNRYMIKDKVNAKLTPVSNIEQGCRGKTLGVTTFLTEIADGNRKIILCLQKVCSIK